MKILTVRQPWAWAIIHGGKDVENRVRNIAGDYRGPVAIHVALSNAQFFPDETEPRSRVALREVMHHNRDIVAEWEPWPWFLDKGHIIGVVDVVDAHQHAPGRGCYRITDVLGWSRYDGADPFEEGTTVCSEWAEDGVHHLLLKSPRPLAEPIPYKGALGLRELPEDVADAIRGQI